jgi:acetyl esterase/lipase
MGKSVFVALMLAAAACVAQAQNIPPQVAERIQEIGPVLDAKMIAEMFQLYAPLMPKAPAGITVKEDLAYGPDERNKLDVFAPAAKPSQPMPVVVFVHGGGYVGGGKSRPGMPFYQNVGYFFARNGVVGVNMTYRLAPKHPWPAGGEDVAAALRWVKANIGGYGGDPKRIVLYGQSAGATHVAHYVFDESLQPAKGADGLRGAILQSGVFDPAGAPPGPNIEAYFGKDRASWPKKSLFHKLEGRGVELFLIDAQYDPEPFKHQTEKLRDELCKQRARGCPRHMELAGHNHLSEILHLNTSDSLMGARILDFVRRLN